MRARHAAHHLKRLAPTLARIDAVDPTRVITPRFSAHGLPHRVWIHPSCERLSGGRPQRGEVEVTDIGAAEGRPEGRLDRLVELRMLHASRNERNGHDVIRNSVGNNRTIDDRHALGHLAQDKPEGNAQGGGDCVKEFGGGFLLPAFDL